MLNLRPSASRGETPLNVGPDLARLEEADAPIRSLMPEPGRAERLERAMATAPNGPLHGLVVGVKDIFHVDGLPTTAGSTLPVEELAGPEAAAVSLLRGAGAVVLGKTVSTEFAFVEPGPTRNPRNLAHTPGGSSSGSAAAVAAGHCPLALGSQTVGSVIRPAAFCGVVGYKPSYGRISTAGMIPLAESFDTVGLLASNVSWVERAAVVLCAWWRRGAVNGVALCSASPTAPISRRPRTRRSSVLDGLGARRVPLFEDIATLNAAHLRLLVFEMARHHARWFPRFADRYRPRTAGAIRDGPMPSPTMTRRRSARIARTSAPGSTRRWTRPESMSGCARPRPAPHPRDWNRPGTRRCSCRGRTPGCRS